MRLLDNSFTNTHVSTFSLPDGDGGGGAHFTIPIPFRLRPFFLCFPFKYSTRRGLNFRETLSRFLESNPEFYQLNYKNFKLALIEVEGKILNKNSQLKLIKKVWRIKC